MMIMIMMTKMSQHAERMTLSPKIHAGDSDDDDGGGADEDDDHVNYHHPQEDDS